jgi:RecB family exonuclease
MNACRDQGHSCNVCANSNARACGRSCSTLVAREQAWDSFRVETETPRTMSIGSLKLDLRLDRIDTFADGAQLVIDYKTGSFKPKSWRGARPADCQLPLYAVSTGCQGVAVLQFTPSTVLVHGVGSPALGTRLPEDAGEVFRGARAGLERRSRALAQPARAAGRRVCRR